MSSDPSTTSARAVVQALVDAGVEHVVLCPGSRSAPLAYALAAADEAGLLRVHVRIDERSAGFLALGLGNPAAVVTTSGTAVANLLPAAWEARHSGVPLLLLTADRPARLRGTWANQTTPLQAGAFREVALLSDDVAASVDVGWDSVVSRAVDRAGGHDDFGFHDGLRGPVHLNIGFDDPLVPDALDWVPRPAGRARGAGGAAVSAEPTGVEDAGAEDAAGAGYLDIAGVVDVAGVPSLEPVPAGAFGGERDDRDRGDVHGGGDLDLDLGSDDDDLDRDMPYDDEPHEPDGGDVREDVLETESFPRGGLLRLGVRRRTVVVAGDGDGFEAVLAAEAGALPMLAEPSSGVRDCGTAINAYRFLLDEPSLGGMVERVLVFGRPTLSRQVARLLDRPDVELVHVAEAGQPGPAREHRRVQVVQPVAPGPDELAWLQQWLDAGRRARAAVDVVLDTWGSLSSLHVARAVAAAHIRLPVDGACLFVAASTVVRDLDLVHDAGADGPPVLASRGLSGIDGSLSTAAGISLGRDRPVRALVGDLAFLHDANGLLVGPTEERPAVQAVVVNDSGGSIFSLLEHGDDRFAGVHERYFATPHAVDLASLCRAHGLPHVLVESDAGLQDALSGWDGDAGVVEVRVDRSRARPLSRAVAEACRAAARG